MVLQNVGSSTPSHVKEDLFDIHIYYTHKKIGDANIGVLNEKFLLPTV